MPEDWVPPSDDPSRSTPGSSSPSGGSNDRATGSDRYDTPRHDSSGDNNRYGNDSNDSNRNTYKSAALDDRGGGFLTTSFQEARDAPPVLVADYNKFDSGRTIGIRGHETEPPKPAGMA